MAHPDHPSLAAPTFDALIVRVVGRAHGLYWLRADGRHEVGPFASLEATLADMRAEAAAASPGRLTERNRFTSTSRKIASRPQRPAARATAPAEIEGGRLTVVKSVRRPRA